MISMIRDKLLALHRNSYSPYSHFPVSAILITKDGRVNLSKDIIKEVEEIEEFMKKYNNK